MNFWDERFAGKEFVYGLEANEFYKSVLDGLHPGDILIPGEGEGRNALYAAKNGWNVTAFDSSVRGKEKAEMLAKNNSVFIDYQINTYQDFQSDQLFDAIALIFTHLSSEHRRKVHEKYASLLKPGGTLLMQVFSKEQLGHKSGGPQDLDLLFSEEELEEDFKSLSSFAVIKEFIELNEGPFHQGKAHLLSVRGIK